MDKKKVFLLFKIAIIPILLLALFFNYSKLIAVGIDHFTGCKIRYSSWKTGRSGITVGQLHLHLNHRGTLKSEKSVVDFDLKKSIEKKAIACNVTLYDISFSPAQLGGKMKTADLIGYLMSPDLTYPELRFSITVNKNILHISDLELISDNVKIEGEYLNVKDKDEVLIDITISISDELYGKMPEAVKTMGLADESEEGWHSTVLSYKGNPAFLKALYFITS